MTTETLNLLRWHAGLERSGPSDRPSIAAVTWKPTSQKDSIDRATAAVLALLEEVNHELNGVKPSDLSEKASAVPRQTIFIVEELRRLLKEAAGKCGAGPDRDALVLSETKIASAWNAIIAGDIDDLRAHVDRQMWGTA